MRSQTKHLAHEQHRELDLTQSGIFLSPLDPGYYIYGPTEGKQVSPRHEGENCIALYGFSERTCKAVPIALTCFNGNVAQTGALQTTVS